MKKYFAWPFAVVALLFSSMAFAAATIDEVRAGWEAAAVAPASEKETRLTALADATEALVKADANNAEAQIWYGIVLAGLAREQGKLAALRTIKKARTALEKGVEIDPQGLNGSAYVTLGAMYAQVPGRPIAFGNTKTAENMFKKALSIRTTGPDVYSYYADFLADQKRNEEAKEFAQKAVAQSPRDGRTNSDGVLIKGAQELLNSL